MSTKKILITALGKGNLNGKSENGSEIPISPDKVEQFTDEEILALKSENRELNYKTATYELDGSPEKIESEFVMEPLICNFQPDTIILLGTIKSMWKEVYIKFAKNTEDDGEFIKNIRELNRFEEGGKEVQGAELENASDEINRIFKNLDFSEQSKKSNTNIKVILLRYGLNTEELNENYEFIKGMNQVFDSCDVSVDRYEVAFDITHSFRSLSIYNLVILNYIKQISNKNIEISHVYYGNLDIREENEGIAPVVDLKDLVDVLNITNGISEFKNTGNSVTLLQEKDIDEELRTALGKFDWATQINDYNKIEESLKLIERVLQKNQFKNGKEKDLGEMIKNVLSQTFHNSTSVPPQYVIAQKQYEICMWYYKQHRYGVAIAAALETLRSLLVPFYLKSKSKEVSEYEILREDNRKASIDVINSMERRFPKSKDKCVSLYKEVNKARIACVSIRNQFAHTLKLNEQYKLNEARQREKIDIFIKQLDFLKDKIYQDEENMYSAYGKRDSQIELKSKDVRIIVSDTYMADIDLNNMKKRIEKTNKKKYQVYVIGENVVKYLGTYRNLKGRKAKKKVITTLYEYLKYYFDVKTDFQVFYQEDMGLDMVMNLSIPMQKEGIKSYYYSRDKKSGQMLSMSVPAICFETEDITEEGSELIKIMDSKPIKL